MRGYPGLYLLAAALAAVSAGASAADEVAGCVRLCPAEKSSLITDPAVIIALASLLVALGKYIYGSWNRKRTINITILTEIARLLEVTSAHLIWWSGRLKDKDTDQVLIPFQTPVYDSQMANLGDLDRRYAGAIVRFYGYVKFLNSMQETQAHYRKRRKAAEFDKSYETALEKLIETYGALFRPAFTKYGIQASFKPVSRRD